MLEWFLTLAILMIVVIKILDYFELLDAFEFIAALLGLIVALSAVLMRWGTRLLNRAVKKS